MKIPSTGSGIETVRVNSTLLPSLKYALLSNIGPLAHRHDVSISDISGVKKVAAWFPWSWTAENEWRAAIRG